MEDINCCICLEVSLTMTSCNHVLCKRCYKKAQTNPQANMQACPCCRRQDYTLKDIIITLNEEQKEAHYKALMDAYNEDHEYVRPAVAVRHRQAVAAPARLLAAAAQPVDPNWNPRRAAMELNFDDAIRGENYHHARDIRQVLTAEGWALNEVREINFQVLQNQMRRVWEINFDAALVTNNYPQALGLKNALVAVGWDFNEVRQHDLEATRLAYNAQREADAAHEVARQERLAANRLARRQAEAARNAEREAVRRAEMAEAAHELVVPQENIMEGAIVLRTMNDYAALEQRYTPRNPARAGARVLLGAGMEIGQLPFNARPMLGCVGCNKKTRRVCGACNDAHCCAACNNCANGCGAPHPANYRRV